MVFSERATSGAFAYVASFARNLILAIADKSGLAIGICYNQPFREGGQISLMKTSDNFEALLTLTCILVFFLFGN